MDSSSVSIIVAGSGGSGVITTATLLLEAAGRAGWYGHMTRSVGAQIRGGEAAAMLRLSLEPIVCHEDSFDVLLGLDWQNLGNYSSEMPLLPTSLIVGDPDQGEVPVPITASGARRASLPFKNMAQSIAGGRTNMIALGVLAGLIGFPLDPLFLVIERSLGHKGEKALAGSRDAVLAGHEAAKTLPAAPRLAPPPEPPGASKRWSVTGNQATGLGAIRGGVRFVAAYPITPATEVMEWMSPALEKVGGLLVQVEDELAAVNQIIGASYGGTPSMTATSGPGLSLMTESLGLAIASETPVVVVDVMRGGPSTGIPAKSEQTDLNIALYGMHGDAPHLVLAPNSVSDCLVVTQWAVHLAETLQTAAIVLSDQAMGQTHAIIDTPPDIVFPTVRSTACAHESGKRYLRYVLSDTGVSPMAIPGTAGCQYTADGLEHTPAGTPSSQAANHLEQMDKRLGKLTQYNYGDAWADIQGEGESAVITWGSCTGAAREAMRRLESQGKHIRLISIRLLFPLRPEHLAAALAGVARALVVEQSHSGQFLQYLRSAYPLPEQVVSLRRPGPLPIRPQEILDQISLWSRA